MTSLPLHPAIVHLPLGLAFVIPALAAGFAWALWKSRIGLRGWISIIALQALLLTSAVVAMNTGEREEDRVESIVPDFALERHEEAAEQFVWATGLTLVLAVLVLVSRRPAIVRGLTLGTVVGTLIVAAAAVRVGQAGGQLVYEHNAGAAYAPSGQTSGVHSGTPESRDVRRRGDEPDR